MIGRRGMAALRASGRPAMIAMAIGLLLSLAGAAAVGQWEKRVTTVEFEAMAETQAIIMQNGMNEYVSRLVALRTLFESANEEVTRSEFEAFSSRLFERHPGMLRIAWIPRVNRKERAEYEAAAASDGISGYRIKSFGEDGGYVTSPPSDEYFPIFYSTEAKTAAVYGVNYAADPQRLAALQRARDDDQITALRARLYQPKDGVRPIGVLIAVPVYAKGTSRTSLADRRRNLAGFVVGIFDLPMLLQSIRATTAASPAVAIDVYRPDADRTAGSQDVADFSSVQRPAASKLSLAKTPQWSGVLRIGDVGFQVRATPAADGSLIAYYYRAMAVFAAGFVITAFLSAYLWLAGRNALQLSRANRRVLELAQTDILTGLPNRAFFLEQLNDAKANARRGDGTFSILMLDLDRFKNVNDSLGHAAGDELLRQVANRLKSTLRSTDVLARLGGDEFAIIQGACDDQRIGSLELAGRISKLIGAPYLLPGHRVEIGTSIGIALSPQHGSDKDELLKKSDLALYRSKSAGRDCYTVYDDAMSADLEARNTLECDLRDAIARCEFEVHYQPFFDFQTGQRRGAEALVRWRHPVRGLVPPDQFIPLAEETGLIIPLGEWVIRRACDDAMSWPDDTKVAVNLSPVQFKQAELFEMIKSALKNSGLPAARLEIEITESVLLERALENHAFIERLKGLGISLALDDFGTGYSSLGSLTAFPFNKIKIDKSFIADLTRNHKSTAIICSILTLALGLDMTVTAEGVETREQFERLKAMGVNFAQGYLMGRPMPLAELDRQPKTYRSRQDAA